MEHKTNINKKGLRRKGIILLIVFIAAVVSMVMLLRRNYLSVNISNENLAHIVCCSRGLGPRTLEYPEHREIIDSTISGINGEYQYVRSFTNRGVSGGGPYVMYLFDHDGNLIDSIYYMNGYIYVPSVFKGRYLVYKNKNTVVDLSSWEKYLDSYGEYINREH